MQDGVLIAMAFFPAILEVDLNGWATVRQSCNATHLAESGFVVTTPADGLRPPRGVWVAAAAAASAALYSGSEFRGVRR